MIIIEVMMIGVRNSESLQITSRPCRAAYTLKRTIVITKKRRGVSGITAVVTKLPY